jgi:hypothetical protein
MDVHKAPIAVSVADANGGEVRYVGEIANTPEATEKLVRQLKRRRASLVLLGGRHMRIWDPSAAQ